MEGLTLQFCALSALLLRKNVKNGLHLYNCLHYLVDILENHDTGSLLLRLPQPESRGGARVCAPAAVLGVAACGVGRARPLRRALRGDPAHAVAHWHPRRRPRMGCVESTFGMEQPGRTPAIRPGGCAPPPHCRVIPSAASCRGIRRRHRALADVAAPLA